MDRVLINHAIVSDIADAVREKTKKTDQIEVAQLPAEIRGIKGVGDDVKEIVEVLTGVVADDDATIANAIARANTDEPTEQTWNGERRTAGGGSIKDGVAFVDKVKGNSLKMVQLITNGDFSSGLSHWAKYSGATAINAPNVENGKLVVNCIADTSGGDAVSVVHTMAHGYTSGNVYLILLSFDSSNSNLQPLIEGPTGGEYLNRVNGLIWGKRITATKAGVRTYLKTGPAKISGGSWSFDNVMFFDLTAMGMEDVTSPDEFAQRLGYASIEELPYIPYTEGEIVSMTASEIKSKGRNLWDEEVASGYFNAQGDFFAAAGYVASKNYIPLPEGKALFFSNANVSRRIFYDANKTFIGQILASAGGFAPPANAAFMRFDMKGAYGGAYKSDVCINLSDPSFNGQYVPYMPPASLPLPISEILDADGNQLFPDGLRGIGDVRDEIDLARGKAIKRIGAVDLGTLSWIYNAPYFRSSISSANPAYPTELNHCLCMKYSASNRGTWDSILDKMLGIYGVNLRVKDSDYTDVTAFKASLAGQLLYYELAEPIEVNINPAKAWYRAENGGSEELVSEGFTAPINAEIGYRGNLDGEVLNLL